MDIPTETTRQVIDRRRLVTLSRLREVLGDVERPDAVWDRALAVPRDDEADLPVVDIHFGTPDGVNGQPAPVRDFDTTERTGADRVARFELGSRREGLPTPVLQVRLSEHLAPDEAYPGSSGCWPPRSARPSTASRRERPSAACPRRSSPAC